MLGTPMKLMDGPMGTELLRHFPEEASFPFERWNLQFPERIRDVHRSYRAAGSALFLTHTFQANAAIFPDPGELRQIWDAAIENVRSVAPAEAVVGDVGPYSRLSPCDEVTIGQAMRTTGVFQETVTSAQALREFQPWIRQHRNSNQTWLVAFSFRRNRDGTWGLVDDAGISPGGSARLALELGVDAIGVGCGVDLEPVDWLEIVRGFHEAEPSLAIFAKPNAGTPRCRSGVMAYPIDEENWVEGILRLQEMGITMAGGCCGTTPRYLEKLAQRMK